MKTLSGGLRQRLGLAQALVGQPRILVLDEPTAGLDPKQRRQFLDNLSGITASTMILLATHLVEDVAAVSKEILIIDRGHLRFAGSLRELCDSAVSGEPPSGSDIERAYLALVESEEE